MAKLEEGAQAPSFTLPTRTAPRCRWTTSRAARCWSPTRPTTPRLHQGACQFNQPGRLPDRRRPGDRRLPDDAASHQRFRNKYGLVPAADRRRPLRRGRLGRLGKTRYGQTSIGVLRSTFLVDEQGRIQRAWHNVKADGHAAKVLEALGPKV